jgi:hypothetical protein
MNYSDIMNIATLSSKLRSRVKGSSVLTNIVKQKRKDAYKQLEVVLSKHTEWPERPPQPSTYPDLKKLKLPRRNKGVNESLGSVIYEYIKKFPREICVLPRLEELDMSQTDIRFISDNDIGDTCLPNLKRLIIPGNFTWIGENVLKTHPNMQLQPPLYTIMDNKVLVFRTSTMPDGSKTREVIKPMTEYESQLSNVKH